jgi:hypothetical protein
VAIYRTAVNWIGSGAFISWNSAVADAIHITVEATKIEYELQCAWGNKHNECNYGYQHATGRESPQVAFGHFITLMSEVDWVASLTDLRWGFQATTILYQDFWRDT